MLEVKINDKECMVNVNGKASEIMTDIVIILRTIYEGLNDCNKDFFKVSMEEIVKSEMYSKTPEEMAKYMEEETKRLSEERKELEKKNLKELKNLFKDMPEELKDALKDILK